MALTITSRVPDAQPYRDEDLDGRIGAAGLAGATLEHGLLRFHTHESGSEAARLLAFHFPPGFTEGWVPFAVDWRGRQYCRVRQDGVDSAVRADPGLFAASSVVDFEVFMDTVLTDPGAARVLGAEDCAAALAARGISDLPFDQCLGYMLPPFAGGEDHSSNILDVPVNPYWAAMADMKNQWQHRQPGAHAIAVAARDGGLTLVFDTDQDPEHSPGAGTRAERLVVTSPHGPAVYNHGLARELTDEQAREAAEAVREAFGTPDAAAPFLMDWRARCYAVERVDGRDVVVRSCPVTMTRTPVAEADGFRDRLAGNPALLDLFGEAEKSLLCARLRLTEIPAGDVLVPPAPPSVAGPEADDPATFRLQSASVAWWLAGNLARLAREAGPERRLQGYVLTPEGRLGLQTAPADGPTTPPRPSEDTAGLPPVRFAPRFAALAETGVVQTAQDDDAAPDKDAGDAQLAIAWYGLAGRVYNAGLFRFLGAEGMAQAAGHLRESFGVQAAEAVPVIVDWLGRYAVREVVEGQPMLVSYDAASGQREELSRFEDGLEQILVTPVARELFDEAGFRRALDTLGLARIEQGRCVGVKRPLFLGGDESPENWEDDSLDVHWSWHGRVFAQARAMPEGARIQRVEPLEDGRPLIHYTLPDGRTGDGLTGLHDGGAPGVSEAAAPRDGAAPKKEKGFFGRMFKG